MQTFVPSNFRPLKESVRAKVSLGQGGLTVHDLKSIIWINTDHKLPADQLFGIVRW